MSLLLYIVSRDIGALYNMSSPMWDTQEKERKLSVFYAIPLKRSKFTSYFMGS